jgi:short-subunit dehydrogenase
MTGRVALVTGASRGIGALVAERFAAQGWDLTISARSPDALGALSDRLQAAHGQKAHAVPADMAAEDDVVRLADAHAGTFDRLDALILNAGMGSIGPLAEFPVRRFDKLYAVNVRANYLLVQHLLPLLRATAGTAGTAKVIAVSSLTGIAGEPLNSAYGASKAALSSLCETLNTEESMSGVTASAVCPGYVATVMTAPLAEQVAPNSMIDPADVAEVVVGLTRLSRSVVVPFVPMTRPGPHLWRA